MPVCIAGMHRSGTSMTTRLLNLAGLSLGPQEDLLAPTTDNPEGYWESRSLMIVNDTLLGLFDGAWDLPPDLPYGWQHEPRVARIREQVAPQLERAFAGQQHWGWKDPRNSLTFPLWRELVPGLKALVCVRNPLEVAASLHKRGYASRQFSFRLWLAYNRAILDSTMPGERVVTHYASYFADPRAELRRVCDELGMPADDATVAAACETANLSLRHTVSSLRDLVHAGAPAEVVTTYLQLCLEAGGVYGPVLESEVASLDVPLPPPGTTGTGYLRDHRAAQLESLVQDLSAQVRRSEEGLQQLIGQLTAKEQEIAHLRALVVDLEPPATEPGEAAA